MKSESAGVSKQTDPKSKTKPTKKKVRGRVTIVRERCKGCGYCVAFCPTGALEMSAEFNAKGYHIPLLSNGGDCNGCDLCGMYCPDFAIHGSRLPGESGEQSEEE